MRFRKAVAKRARHTPGVMNKLEREYRDYLELRVALMEVNRFAFEAIKFRIAEKTFYTPDFMVACSDGTIEFHEVKGYWEDDARVKVKVVAEQNPEFTFVCVTKDKSTKSWKFERLYDGTGQEGSGRTEEAGVYTLPLLPP